MLKEPEKQVDSNVKIMDVSGKTIITTADEWGITANFKYALDSDVYKQQSSDIFFGEIKNVEYITYEGVPWSKMTVKLEEIYKGNRNVEEEVTVYELGGYVEYEEFQKNYWGYDVEEPESTLVEMDYFQPKLHKNGDKSLFCVVQAQSCLPFENGSYELVCSSFSEYRYDKNTHQYCEQKVDDNENCYSKVSHKKQYYSKREMEDLLYDDETKK